MPEDEHSSSNDDATKKRKYNKMAQRQFRKRRQEYIESLEQKLDFLNKNEDVKIKGYQSALQAAKDKNLQLSALIVKMAAQLNGEARLNLQRKEDEIMSLENNEQCISRASTSTEPFEVQKSDSDTVTLHDIEDYPLDLDSSVDSNNEIDSSYQPPIASTEQVNAIAKLISANEDIGTLTEHPHFSYPVSSSSTLLEVLMRESSKHPLGKFVPKSIDLHSYTMGRICVLFTSIQDTMMDTEFMTAPDIFKPTDLQLKVPHPPYVDIIPWASMRDRLIMNLQVLEESTFKEDVHKECTIWGGDPLFTQCWEISPVFFRKYWFLCDKDMVKTSNFWRAQRGETFLKFDNLPNA
ncbi:hypothetical protein BGW37DRAFT_507597 [Umbelopsis sp. PMI_123]|nr:hypothetical protein BGW37DRAFT_507597 [Umbelopsis sp. PMI_123]